MAFDGFVLSLRRRCVIRAACFVPGTCDRATFTSSRNVRLTAAASGKTAATSGSRSTTLVPSRY